ncbi:beta-ketoacyl synthase N-terminal-like domain-containing protein [Uliginosibacterium sp. H3]|uniref:Beta-ketoacyl synthase N-terminal-like domain-containing protein n=1 Tax=Uliginosibacterium silvisoli TaxID=3114758 RepID=A0ABU6K505_9RHOO|nr:beta-ketoacyl synthase N-terminal-like domain-containing protein [Uliginosibacterium sp. H3]
MSSGIVVLSAGAITPNGLSLAETAAAARSRTANLREIEWRDRRFDPFVVGCVPDDGLPELADDLRGQGLQERFSRMLRLAHVALAEAMAPVPESAAPIPLLMGLPEHHTRSEIDPRMFMKYLQVQSGARFHASSLAVPRGRAGGLMAVRQAIAKLESGQSEFVLIGGVDSLVDLYVLGTLDLQGRVRNSQNPDGFAPGEGAAFLLLSTSTMAQGLGVEALAEVEACGIGLEEGHLYSDEPYLGEGLAHAFSELFAQPPAQPVASIYASFNGERYWGKEFGVARLRNSARFAEPLQMEHPAECFGDLGAAHGPVMAALAAQGISAGYRRSPSLIYASSDHGDRAALLLNACS